VEILLLVAGPDAYRDLPNLIHILVPSSNQSNNKEEEDQPSQLPINVQLSMEESYADIQPTRSSHLSNHPSTFVRCVFCC